MSFPRDRTTLNSNLKQYTMLASFSVPQHWQDEPMPLEDIHCILRVFLKNADTPARSVLGHPRQTVVPDILNLHEDSLLKYFINNHGEPSNWDRYYKL